MRVIVGMVACLGVGSVMVALANPPAPAPQPSAAAPAPSAPASPEAAAPAAQTAAAAQDPDEKRLLAMGYKLRLRNGERVFCRSEEELGTRLGSREICGTAKNIMAKQAEIREDTDALRRQSLGANPAGK